MLLYPFHLGDDDVGEILVDGLDGFHWRPQHRETMGSVIGIDLGPQQSESQFTEIFTGYSTNCCKKRMSLSYSSRMSGMPWRSIVMRWGPMPKA